MARFQKGQSGNPKGRPPKSEALRDLLRQALEGEIDTPAGKVSGKALLARLVVEAITTGAVKFPADEERSLLGVKDWVEFLKWAYNYLEPAPTKMQHSQDPDGEPVEVVHIYIPDNGRDRGP